MVRELGSALLCIFRACCWLIESEVFGLIGMTPLTSPLLCFVERKSVIFRLENLEIDYFKGI